MRARLHLLLLAAASALFLAFAVNAFSSQADDPAPDWLPIDISAVPHQFRGDKAPDEPIDLNRVTFLGGLELSSSNKDFGGLSGMRLTAVSPHGDRLSLLMASDNGHWVRAALVVDDRGKPIRLEEGSITPIADASGMALKGKAADAEGLVVEGDSFIASFERNHRLVSYSLENDAAPAFLRIMTTFNEEGLNANGGVEAIARLASGEIVAISQSEDDQNLAPSWLIDADSAKEAFFYRSGEDFVATDAATTANGRLLVLERAFSRITGTRIRIVDVNPETIKAGAIIEGDEVVRLNALYALDNMEAMATVATEKGDRLYLLSDNNFSGRQKTLLLAFELKN